MNKEDRISKANQAIQMLSHRELCEYIAYMEEDYDRLNNIIDELEKWLKEYQTLYGINQQGFSWGVCSEVLEKLKELKENNNG